MMSFRSIVVHYSRDFFILGSIFKKIRLLLNKRKLSRRKRFKSNAIKHHGTFNADKLLKLLQELGIQEGDTLFVQCSFNDLYTFSSSPMELLKCLKAAIGTSGTVLLPAYTDVSKFKPDKPVNLNYTPTYTGIVNEIFRRSTGVIRSLHPRHSVCGYGPLAEKLLKSHHKCKYADGKNSPFDRIRKLKNAKILTLGLPPCYLSFLHWIEDFETNKLPFSIHKKKPERYTLVLPDGSLCTVKDYQVDKKFVTLSLSRVCNKLSSEVKRQTEYKGVSINVYLVMPLAAELIKLRDQNIIHYK